MDQEFDFENIVSQFDIAGTLISCVRYGEGHINETYLAVVNDRGAEVKYILQRINTNLFKEPDKLMNNIRLVTEFSREKIKERGGNPDRESLSLVYAKNGAPYIRDEESGRFIVRDGSEWIVFDYFGRETTRYRKEKSKTYEYGKC